MRRATASNAPHFDAQADNFLPGLPGDSHWAGRGGNDTILGADGDDTLVGEKRYLDVAANDGLIQLGDDLLLGGADWDYLLGDVESATLDGSLGDLAVEFGDDRIADRDGGTILGDANDLTIWNEGEDAGDVVLTLGNDLILAEDAWIYADVFELRIDALESGSVSVTLGNDVVVSSGEAWRDVYGDAYFLWIDFHGGASGDVLVTAGDDTLVSGEGGGYMYGDFDWLGVFNTDDVTDGVTVTVVCGDDRLVSGAGNDLMIGDFRDDSAEFAGDVDYTVITGEDTFVFSGAFGSDEILDFETGHDQIVLDGFGVTGLDGVDHGYEVAEDAYVLDLTDLGGGVILVLGVPGITDSDVVFV